MATGAAPLLRLGRAKKIQKNEASQPAVLSPIRANHSTLSPELTLLSSRTGFQVTRIIKPSATQLAAANFKGFLNNAGAFRSGPRTRPNNTSAPSHSTGVLRNHSWCEWATELSDLARVARNQDRAHPHANLSELQFSPSQGLAAGLWGQMLAGGGGDRNTEKRGCDRRWRALQ